MTTMNPISEAELDALPLGSVVNRMDEFLTQSHIERYGAIDNLFPVLLTYELVNSAVVLQRPEVDQREIAYICFGYLVQLQLDSVVSGMANKILYAENYSLANWSSPVFRLRDRALRQYQIICSRVAFEIFIELLHVIETGRRIKPKKSKSNKESKLKAFRIWLRNPSNRFHYFAHVLLVAYRFDREFRSPEVHGSSPLPRRMLMLQVPSHDENNAHCRLTNTLAGVWRPLIDILNNIRPNYMSISQADENWFHAYMSGSDDAIEEKLGEMLAEDP